MPEPYSLTCGKPVMTPADVHYGKAETIVARRKAVLDEAYRAHPDRFINGAPRTSRPAAAAYINQPATDQTAL